MAFSYLIPADYQKQIQDQNLSAVSGSPAILNSAQLAAEAEAKSYLRQKYDIDRELDATCIWDPTKIYKADRTVYLDAPPYDAAAGAYLVGALTLQAGNVYICIVAAPIPGPFVPAKWTLLGTRYQIFYATLPQPYFDYLNIYSLGNPVFWKDFTYLCLQATAVITPEIAFQQGSAGNAPVSNVFPDDPINGAQFWGTKTAYQIAAGTLPTDTDFWTAADNRDQQMVMYFVDITLYHIHSRIAPRNVPEERKLRYHAAIEWLIMCSRGDVTPELPVLQPKQGGRIRFGGNAKAQNSY